VVDHESFMRALRTDRFEHHLVAFERRRTHELRRPQIDDAVYPIA
jgi:hypothetical protein